MRIPRYTRGVILIPGLAAALAGAASAQDGAAPATRFKATVMIIDSLPAGTVQPGAGGAATGVTGTDNGVATFGLPPVQSGDRNAMPEKAALLAIGVDRWSTEDDTAGLVQVLKAKGTHGLVSALEKQTVGHLQVNGELRWPIRWATTWRTDAGQVVLLATTGRFLAATSRSPIQAAGPPGGTDDQVDILEFTVPSSGAGEGSIVAAVRAGFDDQGHIFPVTQSIGTGAQRMTNVAIATR